MKPAIQLISEYNNIPKGAIFTKYKTSPDLFDFDMENFIVHYKKKEVLLPPNLIRLVEDKEEIEQLLIINEKNLKAKPSPDHKDFIKALQLLKEAEERLYH